MILTNQQAAVVLAVMDAGGTGVVTFKAINSHVLVHFKDSGVNVGQFFDGRRQSQYETYATFDHFRLAHTPPDLARAAAHYIPMAAEAKSMAQHVADGEGRN
ncbi:hypothetical protein [Bordetella bronchialis]|uniref:KTSC domain-containing protein n=1 Tax=Bordetella bronchialis TaxID=463025 RepID=A0ABM6CQZ9_9BORD|nr:hypothetical protein [Bordetella bronchialis]ANN66449.1 hypothetical protein BAU06_09215 [Bordetella bronchialis]